MSVEIYENIISKENAVGQCSRKSGNRMELRKINKEDAKAQWEYTTALPEDENGLTNPYYGVSYD